jgi:hypothetical protein
MKTLLTTIAVLTAFATPTFAQSFDRTGNALPFARTPTAPHSHKIAARRGGLHSFAMVPGAASGVNSESPQNTGGGSLGYNEMLRSF